MDGEGDLAVGEESVLTFHPHWAIMLVAIAHVVGWLVGSVVVALLVSLVSLAAAQNLLYAALALALAGLVLEFLRWRTTTYRLTSRRLQVRSGVLFRSGRDFPLVRISSASFTHGPLGRLLNYGRLAVESPGQHSKLVLDRIPRVERVHATLFRLVEDEQARMVGRQDKPS